MASIDRDAQNLLQRHVKVGMMRHEHTLLLVVLTGCFHLEPGDVRRDAVVGGDSDVAADGPANEMSDDLPPSDAPVAMDRADVEDAPPPDAASVDAPDAEDSPGADAQDVASEADVATGPDVPDVPDAASDGPGSPDAMDVLAEPDAADAPDVADAADVADVADVADAPDVVDAAGDADVVDVADARDAADPCPAPMMMCGSACVDPRTSVTHCGGCGVPCTVEGGTAMCVSGTCERRCPMGQSLCGTRCVDLRVDPVNCGACGMRCASGACGASACLTQRSCAVAGTPGCGLLMIPGGTFTMGAAECMTAPIDATCVLGNAPPQSGITVSGFALDVYEVSVARFNAYWAVRSSMMASVRSAAIRYPSGQTIAWISPPNPSPMPRNDQYNWQATSSDRDAHPLNGIDWWMAQEFCVWDGGTLASDPNTGRLPTEAEWEFAARGRSVPAEGLVSGRVYPWGNAAPGAMCDRGLWNQGAEATLCGGTNGGRTRAVGSFAATGGLFDLAGNVAEWTADNSDPYPSCWLSATNPLCNSSPSAQRIRRGGSWGVYVNDAELPYLRAAARNRSTPSSNGSNGSGFRCARSVP
ncbi:MAG: SUMF1/EgtB/PvdO family nonheme iron enzyme [Polyangiales bacterium]